MVVISFIYRACEMLSVDFIVVVMEVRNEKSRTLQTEIEHAEFIISLP